MPLLSRQDRASSLPSPAELDRVARLPGDIDPDKVEATGADRVLTVRSPLPPGKVAAEPRVIPIKAG
jgi:HSP20 family molecular chaperone IbpA